ncbi:D-alanyl-D-alanine carboxypeptidase [Geosporobacter subterraneus DSM 17957]|uniref:serine-type D-Ala-D-Ala carboxypeptidase n=1 Tax=Geosporobacter subterraneus DSM 17957 TaxID=1121919 RepID=A0A1M6J6T8_9FIRM|nr:D-alanyl-D-alanine carboxypeptidase [Geosporobacter subterraneus DSM 17957]
MTEKPHRFILDIRNKLCAIPVGFKYPKHLSITQRSGTVKRKYALLIGVLQIFLMNTLLGFAQEEVSIQSRAAVLMEFDYGKILWSKNPHMKTPPASITKLMTYHLAMDAVEAGKIRLEDRVTISEKAAAERGTSYNLKAGDVVSLKNLMDAMMIVSGNDAAYAIAEYVGGSAESFVEQMNGEAKRLGMKDTTFVNPNGMPTEGTENITTAWDMAILSQYLIDRYGKDLIPITSSWSFIDPERNFIKDNTNMLLKELPKVDGLKTGFTNAAGYCLSSTMKVASQGEGTSDFRLIAVVLGAQNDRQRVADSKKLLEYGALNYSKQGIIKMGDIVETYHWWNMEPLEIGLTVKEDVLVFGPKEGAIKQQEVFMFPGARLPIEKGQQLGEMVLTLYDDSKMYVELVSDRDLKRIPIGLRVLKWWWDFSGFMVTLLEHFVG